MKKLMMIIVGAVSAMCAFAAELPAGYTAVDAIVAPRGAYIDTGYKPSQNTRVVMDVTVQGAGEYWFGCWDRNYNDGAFAFGNDGGGIYAGYGNQGGTFGSVVANGRHSVELDKGVVKVDGGQVHAFNAATFALANNLYLFAQNRNGEICIAGAQTTIVCHGCAIYDNGTLKRDFVPCVRTADAVAGLYDMVEGKFYGNSGSGNFAMSASNLPFGRELASGTYEINESFAFVAPPMESALKIAEGATVTLNIAAGVTVRVRGGDAHEVWGGGAGIEVPANATLKVTGSGQLVAYGGKGANGCNGLNGGNGSADGSNGNFTSGAGGAGGWGGGGAGAGIGGHGASGGGGGNGGQSVTAYGWSYTDIPGKSGDNGGDGKNGGNCGTVSIEGTVKVFAAGGAAGAADGAGGEGGGCAWLEGSTFYFGGWGGGGGGSGSKGGAAQDIGGGGAGGYGGGGGGSGGYLSRYHWDTFRDTLDNGGGGAGTADGKVGYIANSIGGMYRGSAYPGGAKGTAGARGDNGYLTVAEFAVVVSPSGESDSYSVGRVSVTEHIRWEGGKLYRVVEGVRTEQFSHSVVDADTSLLESGWYVVKGTVSRSKISVNGTVNLVLLHNSSLTASGASSEAGVEVYNRDALNIFGVESGSLTATGGILGAGIGGGDYGVAGTVTINGGVVMATGGISGAGIGGGSHGVVGTVTINGGVVMATGGESGAGIGGGGKGTDGRVTINGGMVTATGGDRGAGIGGGINRGGFFVTINGGTVTATGNDGGAGIGGGLFGSGGEVTINGGIVTATGNWAGGAGIGGGGDGADGKVTLDLTKVEVVDGAVGNGSSYVKIESMTDVLKTEVETFDGNWYVVAPSNVYVNTHFNPDSNTRVTMDVKVQGTGEYWFGCWDRNYNDGAFAFGNDGWGIYAGYGKQGGTFGSVVANGRHTVELNRNVVKVDEKQVNAFNAETFGPLKNNLYLFAQNRNGTLGLGGSQDSIICFGCSISTNSAAGASIPVHNFVPARTKDDQQIVGLYDTVTGWFFAPRGGTLTLGHDESAGPSCEGGMIEWSDAANAWVVTPNAGVTAVTIAGLPEGATVAVPPSVTKVSGVADAQVKVRAGAYDITGAFTVSGGAIALDPNGVVTIGGETIPVKPTIGEPFVVGDGEVSVTVRAIPGLKYSLVRGIELGAITMTVVEPTLATEAQMTLEDTDPPAGAAFYKVGVEK